MLLATPDLKVGAISGSRLLDSGITSAKIYDNTLTGNHINESTLVLTCPAAMTRVGDICFGSSRPAAQQYLAANDCADEQLRLPSISEGRMIDGATPITDEWTDTSFWVSPNWEGIVTYSNSWDRRLGTTPHIYRRVTTVRARP